MKIKEIHIKKFKRFTDLKITGIPENAKLIILVGPNGSGKTSIFEAFNHWYRLKGYGTISNQDYFVKKSLEPSDTTWYQDKVNINFHNNLNTDSQEVLKGKFYFRTAYRNESDFTINRLENQKDPTISPKLETLMGNDITVSENYQRLISQTLSGVYSNANDKKTVEQLREELIGKIKKSLTNIFDDINLSSIGNPLSNGSFYFEKGTSKDFHYKNLSAGEKSVFDLILDLIIKAEFYENAIYCIDEPEAHMHTRLQSKVLRELYSLTPDESQLWISTHSIGMLKEAELINNENPDSVVFLDFDNRDFDLKELMTPSKIDSTIWNRFFDLALADFSKLIAPEKIVFCEGTSKGRKYKDFDAQIYSKIFEPRYHSTKFISLGSSSEIENIDNDSVRILSTILKSSEIIKFIDRDDKSEQEVQELAEKGIKTSTKRHIESYLLDNEIIEKLCVSVSRPDLIETCIEHKEQAMNESNRRGNPPDDVKSASGQIFIDLKRILNITQCGNNKGAFLRDTMTPLITEETKIYQDLEKEIFT